LHSSREDGRALRTAGNCIFHRFRVAANIAARRASIVFVGQKAVAASRMIDAFWQGAFVGGAIIIAVMFERVRNFRQVD
jgi:hypothetical protein